MPSPSMPHSPTGGGTGPNRTAEPARPPLMSRQSSTSSHSSRQVVLSVGSAGEQYPLRHPVKARHTKIVLPRNHNSGRNLAKLARQAQNANANAHALEDGRKHARQRSHEGDTEIRLPGSLDESSKPPMRRNMTAYQLPRNTSHVKLKKNLSHGQLTRLSSGRNLVALNSTAAQRAPPSPGLKGKSKRPKSADLTGMEKQLQEQALQLPRQKQQQGQQSRRGSEKKVGFAVGSVEDASEEEEVQDMEGSGLQEDEWTEESASASPYSTRQNTANNSRRASVVSDRNMSRIAGKLQEANAANRRWESQSAQQESSEGSSNVESESSEPPSPRSMSRNNPQSHDEQKQQPASEIPSVAVGPNNEQVDKAKGVEDPRNGTQQQGSEVTRQPTQLPASTRSISSQQREHQNPTTRRLLDKGQQLPAPALVSNVSALDDTHSTRPSPAPSMRSSRSNVAEALGDGQEDELVSRFVPSASHPSTGSGTNTALNTPKQSGFHSPEEDSTLAAQRRERHVSGFQLGPASPGSPMSGSSGATTPAMQRSRTELRMLQEKAMADLETAADQRPPLPAHVYDRRNESLKSYLNMASLADGRGSQTMGPDLFQGRFRALNTELGVVQKFRNPLGEAVARLRNCKGSRLHQRAQKQQAPGLTSSKSAVSLPAAAAQQRAQKAAQGDLSKSASPPRSAHSLKKGMSGAQQQQGNSNGAPGTTERNQKGGARREVSFARAPPETREFERAEEELAPDVIARRLWEGVV